jgi:molybdenum cofactor synthesis domain-containing protein
MDGYAIVAQDTHGATRTMPARLRIVERIFTAEIPATAISSGTCAEIATGAPLPRGANAVVMVEETAQGEPGETLVFVATREGQNIGARGADITSGQVVVRHGDFLTPARVGAIAAIGSPDVLVYARPRVAILSTGNEVVEPGGALRPGQIFDVNRFTLDAITSAHGCIPEAHPPVPDNADALTAALDHLAHADVVVFSGGSSVGDRDLIADVIAARGEMIFHGVAIKPGKPTAFAVVAGKPFLGMPGNPTSCLTNAYVLLVPFLRALARLPPAVDRTIRVPLAKPIRSQAGRHQFYTVRIEGAAAVPAFKGSGEITSLSQADGYIQIPADRAGVDEGELVEVTLF